MKNIIVIIIALLIFKVIFLSDNTITHGPGVFAPDTPIQRDNISKKQFSFKEYQITPLAEFHIKAKALSVEYYSSGREADLSPIDLALGWGRMSDESVLAEIDISQSGRWYRWYTETMPIPRKEIETHSANMHLIPANDSIEDMMNDVRKGDIVEFSGNLIKADGSDGWLWQSSLTRNDVGAHACEVIWVDKFRIHNYE